MFRNRLCVVILKVCQYTAGKGGAGSKTEHLASSDRIIRVRPASRLVLVPRIARYLLEGVQLALPATIEFQSHLDASEDHLLAALEVDT